eukprot:5496295-Amphidinium_carterae.1
MAVALAVASSDSRLASAREELRFAKSTVRAKFHRRSAVESLARTIAVAIGVAASLKSAGFRFAPLYLDELRLGHIEAGWQAEDWLARVLTNCKRSLDRGLGPVHRAPELRLDDLVPGALQLERDRGGGIVCQRM